MSGFRIIFCSALVLLLIAASAARADDPTPLRVGRIAEAVGDVSLRLAAGAQQDSARAGKWTDAGLNHPIASGMSVRAAGRSRAVLRIGADAVVLAGDTELDIVQLDAGGMRLALRRGRIGIHFSDLDPGRRAAIELGRGRAHLLTHGDYDLIAGDDKSPARLAVFAGTARFSGKGLDAVVASGGAVLLNGSDPVAMLPGGTDEDEFAASWRPASGRQADLPALRHVSPAMTGYEALDEHGSWKTLGGYGAVWFPERLPDGWAPYRHGHWRWVGPWGWTWIDDMQWGFAPAHYGRWARIGAWDAGPGRWGWIPGPKQKDPPYVPAAVAFLGTAGVGLSYPDAFSPAVAWFPLGPSEVYWPDFTDEIALIRRLNAGVVADPAAIGPARKNAPPADIVTADYRNRRFATVVPRSVFLGGKPVAEALIKLPPRRLEHAPLLAGSPQIDPPAPRPAATASAAPSETRTAPKAAKAGEALARILKARTQGKRDVKRVVSKKRELKAGTSKKRDPKARNARANRSAARARTVSKQRKVRSRAATSRTARPRSVGPAKSRAATLRRASESGG